MHRWSTGFRDVFNVKTNDTMKNQDQKGGMLKKLFWTLRKQYVKENER